MLIDVKPLAEIVKEYEHYPLAMLEKDQQFVLKMTGTGENKSRFLTRRFSFKQPKLNFVVSNDKSQIDINMLYGISGQTTLMSLEREVHIHDKNCNQVIFVKNPEEPLSSLEGQIDVLYGVKGFTFPDEVRHRPMKTFFTEESKYLFRIDVKIDTLGCYVDDQFDVQLDYVYIKDCIKGISEHLLAEGIVDEDVSYSIFHLEDIEPPSIALRFKQYLSHTNQQENNE